MVNQKGPKLTRAELDVMKAFWRLGRTSIREIQEDFPAKQRPAYTTVCTVVYRLEAKGAVRRVRKIGNAGIFEPTITPESVSRRFIDEVLEFFGGSVRPLMAHLVESRKLTFEDLQYAEETLAELEANKSKKKQGINKPKKVGRKRKSATGVQTTKAQGSKRTLTGK